MNFYEVLQALWLSTLLLLLLLLLSTNLIKMARYYLEASLQSSPDLNRVLIMQDSFQSQLRNFTIIDHPNDQPSVQMTDKTTDPP